MIASCMISAELDAETTMIGTAGAALRRVIRPEKPSIPASAGRGG
ncbi:MAG: hypothetical protein U1E33_06390 [Rhodospirillales bacterium]